MKKLMQIFRELFFLKRVNVIYEHEHEGMLFVERVLSMDLPRKGDVVIWKSQHYRVGTIWFDKDEKVITVDLSDL